MTSDKKYVVAVALLAVLAVAFGVLGTVAPPLAEESTPVQPQQEPSSDGVGHFQNPPTYDSGWMDIQNKNGQYFNVTHNVNSTEVVVDITGKRTLAGGEHHINYGLLGEVTMPGLTRVYGGTDYDEAHCLVQTGDGGYAIAGHTSSYGVGIPTYLNVWLVKIDAFGIPLWNKTYGGTKSEYGNSVIKTLDGGYAVAGWTYSFGVGTPSSSNFYLVKTDALGVMVWNKTYGGTNDDYAYSVVQTSDGGYALAGCTYSYGNSQQAWLVRTDSSGNALWNKTYGRTGVDGAQSVVLAGDGGYALAGSTNSYGAGSYDCWLVRTDSSGNALWNKTYGEIYNDQANSLIQTGDGGYALGGYTYSYGAGQGDCWLVKTDSSGNREWSKTYGGINRDEAMSVVQTIDGGYALAGLTFSYGAGGSDFWLVKTDQYGDKQWDNTYGGGNSDYGYSLVETSDGGYALAGMTNSYGAGADNFYWVKTDLVLSGLAWNDSTDKTITLYRGINDAYWNYVRVRIWLIKEPSWIYGDINMDGVVDTKDLYILGQNYGKTFSLLSLSGIIGVAGIHTVKKRKQAKQPSYIS